MQTTPPLITQHRWFWPVIALIALLFFFTLALVLRAANATPNDETTVNGSCAPAFLRQYDPVAEGSAALPVLGNVDEMLDQIAPVDAVEADACAAP
ncbi:hypothetical protein VZO05_15260 [Aggregatilineales bacterium SYSU G02658]